MLDKPTRGPGPPASHLGLTWGVVRGGYLIFELNEFALTALSTGLCDYFDIGYVNYARVQGPSFYQNKEKEK